MSTSAQSGLASALFPKSRRAVLGLLFGRPEEAFYLRAVAQLTGLGLGQIQRELARLSDSGILQRTEKGRHVYFQANEACPIYRELRGIVAKTLGASAELQHALQSLRGKIEVAFIFGSVARGEERPESDLDLLVIGTASFAEIVDAIREAEATLGRPVSVTVYPPGEFTEKVSKRHHFLTKVMQHEKLFLVGGEDELAALSRK